MRLFDDILSLIALALSVAIIIALLTSCAAGPQRAASIDDYCQAVVAEAEMYLVAKERGALIEDARYRIGFQLAPYYPPREIRKMMEIVDMVYAGVSPAEIQKRCVAEQVAGTWFKGDS